MLSRRGPRAVRRGSSSKHSPRLPARLTPRRGGRGYVVHGVAPLVSADVYWPGAGGAMRKLVRLLLLTIMSSVVIAGVRAPGRASLTAAGEGGVGAGVEQVLAGVAMLALAAIR